MSKQCFNVIERNAYNGRIVNVTCNLTEDEAQSLAREIVDAMVEHDVQHSAHHVSEERLAELEDNAWDCVEVESARALYDNLVERGFYSASQCKPISARGQA